MSWFREWYAILWILRDSLLPVRLADKLNTFRRWALSIEPTRELSNHPLGELGYSVKLTSGFAGFMPQAQQLLNLALIPNAELTIPWLHEYLPRAHRICITLLSPHAQKAATTRVSTRVCDFKSFGEKGRSPQNKKRAIES